MSTVESLAEDLGLHPGDVTVVVEQHGVSTDRMTDQDAADIRRVLDEHCVGTVPNVWWPGSDPDAGTGATQMR